MQISSGVIFFRPFLDFTHRKYRLFDYTVDTSIDSMHFFYSTLYSDFHSGLRREQIWFFFLTSKTIQYIRTYIKSHSIAFVNSTSTFSKSLVNELLHQIVSYYGWARWVFFCRASDLMRNVTKFILLDLCGIFGWKNVPNNLFDRQGGRFVQRLHRHAKEINGKIITKKLLVLVATIFLNLDTKQNTKSHTPKYTFRAIDTVI